MIFRLVQPSDSDQGRLSAPVHRGRCPRRRSVQARDNVGRKEGGAEEAGMCGGRLDTLVYVGIATEPEAKHKVLQVRVVRITLFAIQ